MPHIENLITSIDGTSTFRSCIVWLVGLPGTGKTSLLHRLMEKRSNYQHININKLPCEKLLDDAPDKRRFIGGTYLADILRPKANDAWLVDNIEVLFSNELKSIVDSHTALGQ
jgi:broad-specificity NMP kinase